MTRGGSPTRRPGRRPGRQPGGRPRQASHAGPTLVGARYEVETGPVAHGGHVVARLPADLPVVGGSVVFVRHALPGERVTVQVTEGAEGDRFLRADAVVVHEASPDRVVPPCPYAGPGRCGGCDLQHVDLAAQRRWKAAVVTEQLRRLAGLDLEVEVEPVPGDVDGLGWRTRMRFARTPEGGLGLHAHRSRRVVPVARCLIAAPDAVTVVDDAGTSEPGAGADEPVGVPVAETVLGRRFAVAGDGFWQAHRGAPETLVRAVLDAARPQPGEVALDLYCGVGVFAAFLADAVGPTGRVVGVEGDRTAAEHARANLADQPCAEVVTGPVDRVLARSDRAPRRVDVVVLDPPREGAKRRVLDEVTARDPRVVVLVACDPASFARDTGLLAAAGYRLAAVRAFDLFPMTHHVEVVGTFERTEPVMGQGA